MLDWIEDEALRAKLEPHFTALAAMDETEQGYERYVREKIVQVGVISEEEWIALDQNFRTAVAQAGFAADEELPGFFICFEWCHRNVHDIEERQIRWRRLLRTADERLSQFALFQYARSRYYNDARDHEHALESALSATNKAPNHVGLLNNYTELLLGRVEALLIESGDGLTDELKDQVAEALDRFESIVMPEVYPIFYVSKGRLKSCLGDADGAMGEFVAAQGRATQMFKDGHPRMKDVTEYVTEMSKITSAQSTALLVANAYKLRDSFTDVEQASKERVADVNEQLGRMEERLDAQRVDMVEFLGFFAGIISFIVASIQIGADMDFTSRAFLLVVMLGTLLIAFGCLGLFLDKGARIAKGQRSVWAARGMPMIAVGFALIVLGVALRVFVGA